MNQTCPRFQENTCSFSAPRLISIFSNRSSSCFRVFRFSLTHQYLRQDAVVVRLHGDHGLVGLDLAKRIASRDWLTCGKKTHIRRSFTKTDRVTVGRMTSFPPWWSPTSSSRSANYSTPAWIADRDWNSTSTCLRWLSSARLQISRVDNERILMWGQVHTQETARAAACISNEDPNQCFIGKNGRYRNAAILAYL